jgi:hypothetical protein
MRSASGSNREWWARRPIVWLIRVAIATLCLPVHGCDTVTGGAVELSWKLRPASSSLNDKFVDCDSRPAFPVTKIRLHWEVDTGDGEAGSDGSAAWLCEFNHGVTGFDLAEGTAKLWVTPECKDGPASPDTYIAPAVVLRSVAPGDTVSLGAVELVVAVSSCQDPGAPGDGVPCICEPTSAGSTTLP